MRLKELQDKFASVISYENKTVQVKVDGIVFDVEFTAVRTPEDVDVVIKEVWLGDNLFAPWGWQFNGSSLVDLAMEQCSSVYKDYIASGETWDDFIENKERN